MNNKSSESYIEMIHLQYVSCLLVENHVYVAIQNLTHSLYALHFKYELIDFSIKSMAYNLTR